MSKAIQKRIKEKISQIDSVAHHFPGVITIHNVRTHTLEYMCRNGLSLLNTTMDELKAIGTEYHTRYFNPEESKDYAPKILGLLQKNSYEEIASFFQQVRLVKHNNHWVWHCTGLRVILKDKDQQPLLAMAISIPIDTHNHWSIKADKLVAENTFVRKNYQRFATLTKREKTALKLFALGKTSPKIATEMHISSSTVDSYRKSIKEKLGVKTVMDMAEYARAFDLV